MRLGCRSFLSTFTSRGVGLASTECVGCRPISFGICREMQAGVQV